MNSVLIKCNHLFRYFGKMSLLKNGQNLELDCGQTEIAAKANS